MIRFRVPCLPVAQPRERVRAFQAGGKTIAHHYTPTKHPVNALKASVQKAFADVYQGAPLRGPIRCDIVFVFARQAAKIWKTKPMPRYRHVTRPDRDNSDKPILDCLTGIAWVDDCQVCDGRIEKWHAAGDEAPHVLVTITELTNAACEENR